LVALGFLVSACGPTPLAGKVEVVGGSSGGVLVLAYGAVSVATVTDDTGAFKLTGLSDGDYVVKAAVKGTEEKEQQLAMKVKDGKPTPELTLTFHMPSAKVSGHVVFADGSDATNLPVNLTGDASRATTTTTGGNFTFEAVPAGGYVVTVEAGSTLEGRVAVAVAPTLGQAVDLGALEFTPLGVVQGVVSQGATPVDGVQVVVAGETQVAQTDTAGRFTLTAVRAGARTLVATKGAGLTLVSATQAVTVARGKNAPVTMSLSPVPAKTGTVSGVVTFNGTQSPVIIALSVPGTAVAASPAIDGTYSLTVPVGTWDVVATAPYYPKQTLGRVTVLEGQPTTLKPAILTWFQPIYVENTGFSAVTPVGVCAGGAWGALSITAGADKRLVFLNTKTLERRHVAAGNIGLFSFSSKCKYATFTLNGVLMVYEVGTSNLQTWGAGAVSPTGFSTDESTLFVTRNGDALAPQPLGLNPGLERINLAAGTSTSFQAGAILQVARQTLDRYFVTKASNDVVLVTPTTDTIVFTAVLPGTLNVSPAAHALTACSGGVSCTLKVLSPTGTTANSVAGTYNGASPTPGSNADWIAFSLTPTAPPQVWKLVRTSDAYSVPMPANLEQLWINSDSTRIAYRANTGAVRTLREESLATVTGTVTPFVSSPNNIEPNWLSNTRLVAYDGTPFNKVYEVKAGGVTTDSDVAVPLGAQVFCTGGSIAVYPQNSVAKWKVLFGDTATFLVDGPNVSGVSDAVCYARSVAAGQPAVNWGYFSIDQNTTYVVDAAGNQVKRALFGRSNAGLPLNVEGLEVFGFSGTSLASSFYLPVTGQVIQWAEPNRSTMVQANLDSAGGFSSIMREPSLPSQTLYVARFWP
jgi:hypothetical protein